MHGKSSEMSEKINKLTCFYTGEFFVATVMHRLNSEDFLKFLSVLRYFIFDPFQDMS